jgi:hypothetical protein
MGKIIIENGILIFTVLHEKRGCPATCHGGAWGERMYSSYDFT